VKRGFRLAWASSSKGNRVKNPELAPKLAASQNSLQNLRAGSGKSSLFFITSRERPGIVLVGVRP